MLVAHRKGLALDRPRNLILYGYGAFLGWNSFLWYQPWLAEWFLAHDGIFAVARVRGGGEHGEVWHEAGRRRLRQNAIDDFIAAAEDLIRRGLTDRSRLVANSSSLAGNLAATAVEQCHLFGAALIDYAVLDLLRYLEFGQARSWLEELGDPADAADFGPLCSISPYHNVDPEACYPPILARPGEHDPIVTPVHSYKWVARLQTNLGASKRRCQRVALLDVLEGAGHDYGSTPAEIARAHAVALAFLDRVLPGALPPTP